MQMYIFEYIVETFANYVCESMRHEGITCHGRLIAANTIKMAILLSHL